MPYATLFPTELTKYDPWVIREALHNCIAHQNYELNGRISVVEKQDELIFSNAGSFIPGNVETVISQDSPPEVYRNPFLADAMVKLNMIDTVGGGIRKMFNIQRERFFPMPDYDLSQPDSVVVKISGRILDEHYTKLLSKNIDLDLSTVILLDKIQKKIPITKEAHKFLKSKNLVEGRYPNIFISSKIAAMTERDAQYIKNKGFNKKYYQDMILALIQKKGSATRQDIVELLLNKLPDVFNDIQKKKKIDNLIYEMAHRLNLLENAGSRKRSKWILHKKEIS